MFWKQHFKVIVNCQEIASECLKIEICSLLSKIIKHERKIKYLFIRVIKYYNFI